MKVSNELNDDGSTIWIFTEQENSASKDSPSEAPESTEVIEQPADADVPAPELEVMEQATPPAINGKTCTEEVQIVSLQSSIFYKKQLTTEMVWSLNSKILQTIISIIQPWNCLVHQEQKHLDVLSKNWKPNHKPVSEEKFGTLSFEINGLCAEWISFNNSWNELILTESRKPGLCKMIPEPIKVFS